MQDHMVSVSLVFKETAKKIFHEYCKTKDVTVESDHKISSPVFL